MADVIVLGTVAADVVLRVAQLPGPGEHIDAESLGWRLGGSSANVACGLAAAGHRVELAGPLGTDALADQLVAELERRGVGTGCCVRIAGPSPRALILLDAHGERTIVVLRGAHGRVPVTLPEHADCIYVESYERFPPVADRAALVVATAPVTQPWPADVIVGSEHQLAAEDPYAACRAAAGPRLRWVVVTRGSRGADAYGPDGTHHADARPARQVDATGAGDAFTVGLIAGLLDGRDIDAALALGTAHGAAAVELVQSVPPDWADLP